MSQSSARVRIELGEMSEKADASASGSAQSAAPASMVPAQPAPVTAARPKPPAAPPPEPAAAPEPGTAGMGAWLAAWGELGLLGLLAVFGAFFASADNSPGDYTCGMFLAVASIGLAFLRIKARFDGVPADWASFLLVEDWPNLAAVIVVFVVVALAGLFVAAGFEYGGLHNAGIALFVVSGIAIFLNLKHVFDNADRRP